jgi:hypothetical protein
MRKPLVRCAYLVVAVLCATLAMVELLMSSRRDGTDHWHLMIVAVGGVLLSTAFLMTTAIKPPRWLATSAAAITGAIGLLVAGFGVLFATSGSDRIVARNLSVGPDWLTITPKPPIRVSHRHQTLLVDLPSGARFDLEQVSSNGVFLEDGRVIQVEAELVSEAGVAHRLDRASLLVARQQSITLPASNLPDLPFTHLRIRSSAPFTTPYLVWQCWDGK